MIVACCGVLWAGVKFTTAQSRAWATSAAVSVAVEWFITNPTILLLEYLFIAVVRSRYVQLMTARDKALQARQHHEAVDVDEYEYELEYEYGDSRSGRRSVYEDDSSDEEW